jgi:hypothetical protein
MGILASENMYNYSPTSSVYCINPFPWTTIMGSRKVLWKAVPRSRRTVIVIDFGRPNQLFLPKTVFLAKLSLLPQKLFDRGFDRIRGQSYKVLGKSLFCRFFASIGQKSPFSGEPIFGYRVAQRVLQTFWMKYIKEHLKWAQFRVETCCGNKVSKILLP